MTTSAGEPPTSATRSCPCRAKPATASRIVANMNRDELDDVLPLVVERVRAYLAALDDAPLHGDRYEEAAWSFDGPLPEEGAGGEATLRRLLGEIGRASCRERV